MRRREFIAGLGAVAASPGSARAQQATMPVVGFLSSASRDQDAGRLRAFHEGLAETGYVEGRNVAVEDRWADEQNERLPQLAADLVNRRVDVIATSGHVLAVFAGPWQRRAIEQAARQLEVKLQVIEMRPEFDPVFAEVRAERVQGLVFLSSPVVSRYAARWTALASAAGLPTISLFPEFAHAGGPPGVRPHSIRKSRLRPAMISRKATAVSLASRERCAPASQTNR